MGASVRFVAARGGAGVGPKRSGTMLRRIDAERIAGTLALLGTVDSPETAPPATASLAAGWDAAVAMLPSDWSDLLCELDLTSSDHIDRGALLLAPINPIQSVARTGFRFRCAHTFGYGASAGMVRRCLARLDEAGIPGEVRVLRALSDTHPVGDTGPGLVRRRAKLSDEPDPVAWTMIEPGWKVLDASGKEVGHVAEVLGDPNADIFDGLNLRKGLLSGDDYVPSERVGEIREGEVHLA